MSEYNRVVNCIINHLDCMIKNYDAFVEDIYITEENRETVRGKYFNLAYVILDYDYVTMAEALINHCCNNHV